MKSVMTISLVALAVSFGPWVEAAYAKSNYKAQNRRPVATASQATRNHVAALIKAQAAAHGVPAWFALRIAKVESNYNPNVTGLAGEIGVFQLKCATAKGIGYKGACSGLYNPATNVKFGLKHLSLAIRAAEGNLKLAASKHNGGLGCKRLVSRYVKKVFNT